jgi:hypothetical protein
MPFLCDGSGKKQQNLPDLLLRVSQAKPYLSVGRHPIGDRIFADHVLIAILVLQCRIPVREYFSSKKNEVWKSNAR